MKTKPLFLSLAILLLAAGGGAWWLQQAKQAQTFVATTRAPLPDLSGSSERMRQEFAVADARARSLRHARDGFAELALLYHANGFLDAAMISYEGLARLDPDEPRWPHLHATILAGYGDIEPALALWQRVIALAPDYTPARLRVGDSLLKNNRRDEAAAAYTAVLDREPDNAHALLGLARIDLEQERWDQARERLESIVRRTNYQLGYDLIVSLYERLGLHDRAAAIRGTQKASGAYRDAPDPWLDELIEVCFDPYRLSLAAGFAGGSGENEKARRLLERAIAIAPNDIAARFQLGTFAKSQGDVKTAREQLERCTIIAPDFSDGWAHLSALHEQLGDRAAAEHTLLTGLQHCPDSPGLHLMRARNLREAGRIDEAFNEYMISINLRPNEPEAYIELGSALISAGREAEGIEQIRRSLETDPANPTALMVLAYAAIGAGDENEARTWLTRIRQQPRAPREQVAAVLKSYRGRFGHEWRP